MIDPVDVQSSRLGRRSVPFSAQFVLPLLAILGGIALLWIALETNWFFQLSGWVSRESPVLRLIEYGEALISTMGYPGLVLIIVIENVFPPIPSDVVLPLSGYTAATTSMALGGAIFATTGGSLIGAMILYCAGAWLGEERVRRFAARYGRYLTFEEAELDRSLDWFRRHGPIVVMVARVVPVFRSLISIPAGMSRMPIGRFLIFTALGAGAWNTGLILAGYLLGSNWDQVVSWMDTYQLVMISLGSVLFVGFVSYRVRVFRRRMASREAESLL